MRKQLLLLTITLIALQSSAQNTPKIEMETWSDNPALHTIDKKFENESAVILLDTRTLEYIDGLSVGDLHELMQIDHGKAKAR